MDRESNVTDEITIYGYNSATVDASNPQPEWVVSLTEYLWNASCTFVDSLIDSSSDGGNETQYCRPDLQGLYDKCLITYREDTSGSILEDGTDEGEELDRRRNAQIETLVSSVDKLCIYRNIGGRSGFMEPYAANLDVGYNLSVELGVEQKLDLSFEEVAATDHPCNDRYADGYTMIDIDNFVKGTYCMFMDQPDDINNNFTLRVKQVYEWTSPFMRVYKSDFYDNFAFYDGGAIAMVAENAQEYGSNSSETTGDYSSMMVKETSFTYNNASQGSGGAIYRASAVDDLIVLENENGNGYALYSYSTLLQIEDINSTEYSDDSIDNYAGTDGGWIAVVAERGTNAWKTGVYVNGVDFTNNFAEEYGGAVYSYWGNVHIVDCYFARNMVYKSGGGIYLQDSGFSVLESLFMFNEAINVSADISGDDDPFENIDYQYDNDGGAISSQFYDENYLNPPCIGFYSTRFENNTAGNAGGAIWLGLYGM